MNKAMRADIPHVDAFVHLNNAAGSLPNAAVHEAIHAQLDREARMGSTEAMQSVAGDLAALYDDLGQLTGVDAERVMISGSNTYAWQTLFAALQLREGDRILVGETEWGGNLSTIWRRCQRDGCTMEIVPSDEHGAIDVAALTTMLDDRIALVCVTEAPAVNGLANPLGAIADALADHPAWLFVDAAQAFGQRGVRPHPRADVTTVSARKFLRAPRGTGFATLSERANDALHPVAVDQFSAPWGLTEEPRIRADARRFEFGEASYAARKGMAAAVRAALDVDWMKTSARIAELASCAREGIAALPGFKVHDTAPDLTGLVTFTQDRMEPARTATALRDDGINIAAPAPVYAPLWFRTRPRVARLSPHAFNTRAEIERTVEALARTTH